MAIRRPGDTVPLSRRIELCQRNDVTIDGKYARITGYGNRFAHVVADGGVCVEYAWQTVDRIVTMRGAAFTS